MKWLLLLFFLCSPAFADRVLYCHDGDTCKVEKKGQVFSARFYGIDAPELKQPFGVQSRDFLSHIVSGKDVQLLCRGVSFKKRHNCHFFVDGKDVSILMVSQGLAWDYPQFSKGKYAALQTEAQNAKRGLCQRSNLVHTASGTQQKHSVSGIG